MPGIPADFPLETFEKYTGLALPRHVSYPMPTAWSEKDGEDFAKCFAETGADNPDRGISLYLHIPFCEALCKFCACNRMVVKKGIAGAEDRKRVYLQALNKEIEAVSGLPGTDRPVRQIHWGGGSPTYLEPSEIEEIQRLISSRFNVSSDAEIAMEIDPRTTTEAHLDVMSELGFNRLSMGIQDFDPTVQEHVHRVQTLEMVRHLVESVRRRGLGHVNFDLIYGMPYQTPETVRDMVSKTIELSPDRVAFYHYAQIPEKIATQRGMDYTRLPDSIDKLGMFLEAIDLFEASGYVFVGLDHFARPDDELALALRDGTVQRNFQGMTTHGGLDLVGLGVSSISHSIGTGFWQNEKEIEAYQESAVKGNLPRVRGIHFSEDDRIRQRVLSDLYCHGRIDLVKIGRDFEVDPFEYFAREIGALEEISEDGLVEFESEGIVVATKPLGRVLLRSIGAVFDSYLDPDAYKVGDRYYYSVSA
jgi:oxygen-independent coproporphyrinogen III oxidase